MPLLQERVSVTFDKILLATDFSTFSETATAYAKAIAKRFGSEVDIAHVHDPSKEANYEETILSMPLAERRKNIADSLEDTKLTFNESGIKVQTVSIEGHQTARLLLKHAAADHADLIVAGTQSKAGVERMLLGSTAEELIRGAACAVLTVGPHVARPPAGPLLFRSIVFATDFSSQAAKAAVFALSFAEDGGAHLYVCHIAQAFPGWQREAPITDALFIASLARMIPNSTYDWCSPECVLEHGEAAKGILEVADRVHADLIVLGARKETFLLKHHLEHGLTPDLLAQAKCPILTVC